MNANKLNKKIYLENKTEKPKRKRSLDDILEKEIDNNKKERVETKRKKPKYNYEKNNKYLCQFEDCFQVPNYGDPKTGISIHCFKHHNPNVDALLKNKKKCVYPFCLHHACNGFEYDGKRTHCNQHKLVGQIYLLKKITCIEKNCNVSPIYGNIINKKRIHCYNHRCEGEINLNFFNKKCKITGCNGAPHFGAHNSTVFFCIDHKEDHLKRLEKKNLKEILYENKINNIFEYKKNDKKDDLFKLKNSKKESLNTRKSSRPKKKNNYTESDYESEIDDESDEDLDEDLDEELDEDLDNESLNYSDYSDNESLEDDSEIEVFKNLNINNEFEKKNLDLDISHLNFDYLYKNTNDEFLYGKDILEIFDEKYDNMMFNNK